MIKIFTSIMACLLFSIVHAKENITVVSYLGPGSSISLFYKMVVDQANAMQDRYVFVMNYKPGAQGLLALQDIDQSRQTRLALISAGYVDLIEKQQIKRDDYIPINSGGNTCWVIMSPRGSLDKGLSSLRGERILNLSTVGLGTSTHLTSLLLAERLGFTINPVIFKTGIEGVILMASDESIHLAVDTPTNYLNFRSKNPNIKALGTNCAMRNPKVPDVRTFREQGFDGISVWSFAVAHNQMEPARREDLGRVLDQAMAAIGQEKIFEKFDLFMPTLNGQTTEEHFRSSMDVIERNRRRFEKYLVQ